MKYTIDTDNDTCYDTEVLSLEEVADQLRGCGAFDLGDDEKIGEVVREDGDLVVFIDYDEPMDVRIHGCRKREVAFSLVEINNHFTAADYYSWAKDEDGNDVLMCFGC